MKSVKNFIILASISAVYCGGPSPCEPFASNFQAFEQAWFNLVDQYQDTILTASSAYPVFTPALVEIFKCQTNSAFRFVVDVISHFSGVDRFYVAEITNGNLSSESETPIGCISNDIIIMRQYIWSINVNAEHLLENSVQPETTPNTCAELKSRFKQFKEIGVNVSKQMGVSLNGYRIVFQSLGIDDYLWMNNLMSQIPCLHKSVGIALGSLLNSDGSVVTQYLTGETTVLPYPFSCIESELSFIKNNLNRRLSELYYGTIDSFDFKFGKID
ncbi:hypothetical protein ACKWTF_008495 [Chironomus riparius]